MGGTGSIRGGERATILHRAGEFWEGIRRTELAFKRRLGGLHSVYLLKQLSRVRDYGWRDKLAVLRTRQDPRFVFTKSAFDHRYALAEEYRQRHQAEWLDAELHIHASDRAAPHPEETRCFFTGAHEIFFEDLYALDDILRPGDVVVDGGTNVGLFGIRAKESAPGIVLHGFEPESANLATAAANLDRYEDVHLHGVALGAESGTVTLRVSHNPQVHSLDDPAITFRPNAGFHQERTVPLARLDDMIDGRVDVIKLDIEGAEMLALHGAQRIVERHRPVLIVAVEHAATQHEEVMAWARGIDSTYRPRELNPQTVCLSVGDPGERRAQPETGQ